MNSENRLVSQDQPRVLLTVEAAAEQLSIQSALDVRATERRRDRVSQGWPAPTHPGRGAHRLSPHTTRNPVQQAKAPRVEEEDVELFEIEEIKRLTKTAPERRNDVRFVLH